MQQRVGSEVGGVLRGWGGGEKTKKEGEHWHIGWPRGGLAAYAGDAGAGIITRRPGIRHTHWDRLHKVTVPSTQPLWWVEGRLTTTPLSILSSSVAQQDCVVLQQRDHLSVIFLHYGCGDRERESTNGAPC